MLRDFKLEVNELCSEGNKMYTVRRKFCGSRCGNCTELTRMHNDTL